MTWSCQCLSERFGRHGCIGTLTSREENLCFILTMVAWDSAEFCHSGGMVGQDWRCRCHYLLESRLSFSREQVAVLYLVLENKKMILSPRRRPSILHLFTDNFSHIKNTPYKVRYISWYTPQSTYKTSVPCSCMLLAILRWSESSPSTSAWPSQATEDSGGTPCEFHTHTSKVCLISVQSALNCPAIRLLPNVS